ncbi:hypothetical protein INR49_006001 [Caranx melampygus]|nr:hypothetical protein INR49_006001 [Caranx melampygus]
MKMSTMKFVQECVQEGVEDLAGLLLSEPSYHRDTSQMNSSTEVLPAMVSDLDRGDPCSGLGPWAGAVLTRVGWVVLTKEQWRNEAGTAAALHFQNGATRAAFSRLQIEGAVRGDCEITTRLAHELSATPAGSCCLSSKCGPGSIFSTSSMLRHPGLARTWLPERGGRETELDSQRCGTWSHACLEDSALVLSECLYFPSGHTLLYSPSVWLECPSIYCLADIWSSSKLR